MIPPVLAADTTYNGTVVWEPSGGGATATQTFSFTTGAMSNTVTIGADVEQTTVNINVTNAGAESERADQRLRRISLSRRTPTGGRRPPSHRATWTACAESGGSGTIYQAGDECTTFTISVIPTAPTGRTGRPARPAQRAPGAPTACRASLRT